MVRWTVSRRISVCFTRYSGDSFMNCSIRSFVDSILAPHFMPNCSSPGPEHLCCWLCALLSSDSLCIHISCTSQCSCCWWTNRTCTDSRRVSPNVETIFTFDHPAVTRFQDKLLFTSADRQTTPFLRHDISQVTWISYSTVQIEKSCHAISDNSSDILSRHHASWSVTDSASNSLWSVWSENQLIFFETRLKCTATATIHRIWIYVHAISVTRTAAVSCKTRCKFTVFQSNTGSFSSLTAIFSWRTVATTDAHIILCTIWWIHLQKVHHTDYFCLLQPDDGKDFGGIWEKISSDLTFSVVHRMMRDHRLSWTNRSQRSCGSKW